MAVSNTQIAEFCLNFEMQMNMHFIDDEMILMNQLKFDWTTVLTICNVMWLQKTFNFMASLNEWPFCMINNQLLCHLVCTK